MNPNQTPGRPAQLVPGMQPEAKSVNPSATPPLQSTPNADSAQQQNNPNFSSQEIKEKLFKILKNIDNFERKFQYVNYESAREKLKSASLDIFSQFFIQGINSYLRQQNLQGFFQGVLKNKYTEQISQAFHQCHRDVQQLIDLYINLLFLHSTAPTVLHYVLKLQTFLKDPKMKLNKYNYIQKLQYNIANALQNHINNNHLTYSSSKKMTQQEQQKITSIISCEIDRFLAGLLQNQTIYDDFHNNIIKTSNIDLLYQIKKLILDDPSTIEQINKFQKQKKTQAHPSPPQKPQHQNITTTSPLQKCDKQDFFTTEKTEQFEGESEDSRHSETER